MAHPNMSQVVKDHGDKLDRMIGKSSPHASQKATRIISEKANRIPGTKHATKQVPVQAEDKFIGAPARQVSLSGKVQK